MRLLFRFYLRDVMVLAAGMFLSHAARAVTPCADLPPSLLRVYDIKASVVEAIEIQGKGLAPDRQASDLISQHSLMLSGSDLVTAFEITHRVVPQTNGLFCDAPSVVRIGFGSSHRVALLARAAAADACVRHEMLEHEAAHARALNEVVDRFIERQQGNLRRGMVALKQTPAPNVKIAKARWEAGLRAIVAEASRHLLDEARAASAQLDEAAALFALENACGGKIRQLQESTG